MLLVQQYSKREDVILEALLLCRFLVELLISARCVQHRVAVNRSSLKVQFLYSLMKLVRHSENQSSLLCFQNARSSSSLCGSWTHPSCFDLLVLMKTVLNFEFFIVSFGQNGNTDLSVPTWQRSSCFRRRAYALCWRVLQRCGGTAIFGWTQYANKHETNSAETSSQDQRDGEWVRVTSLKDKDADLREIIKFIEYQVKILSDPMVTFNTLKVV